MTFAFIEFHLLAHVAQGPPLCPLWTATPRTHPQDLLNPSAASELVLVFEFQFIASLSLMIPFLCCKLRCAFKIFVHFIYHFEAMVEGRFWFYLNL